MFDEVRELVENDEERLRPGRDVADCTDCLLPVLQRQRAPGNAEERAERAAERVQGSGPALLERLHVEPPGRLGQAAKEKRLPLPSPPANEGETEPCARRRSELEEIFPLRLAVKQVRRLPHESEY